MKAILVNKKHEYDYEVNDNVHTLKYSDNGDWTFPKSVAMQIVDDGNSLIVNFNENGRINYSEAEELLILLKLINKDFKYEMITNTIEL